MFLRIIIPPEPRYWAKITFVSLTLSIRNDRLISITMMISLIILISIDSAGQQGETCQTLAP